MLNFINQNWASLLVSFFSLVIGLIGLILYIKSSIGARPMCQMTGRRLLGTGEHELPPQIKILFQDVSIPRLSVSQIFFWNGGKKTLNGSQVVKDDPLRCEFEPPDQILGAWIGAYTRSINKVTLQRPNKYPSWFTIEFDYLDPADGVRIDVFHTSTLKYPKILGSIRGIPKGVHCISPSFQPSLSQARRLKGFSRMTKFVLVASSIFFLVGLMPTPWLNILKEWDIQFMPNTVFSFRFFLIGFGCIYSFPAAYYLWKTRKMYPSVLGSDREEKKSTVTKSND